MTEYAECLSRNLACDQIDEVCILVEGDCEATPNSGKIRLRQIPQRPLYATFFAWINEVANPGDISIVSNTDIWFDASIAVAAHRIGHRECFALSRWDGETLYDHNDSQDCWVFRGPVKGVRCDNRILYELQAAGYRVLNPAFSVQAQHVHSGIRHAYPGKNLPHFVPPPYRYLWPHNLLGPIATLWHNLWHPGQKLGWRFDRRKAARWFPVRVVRKVIGCVGTANSR
jgi:hypothetical protein